MKPIRLALQAFGPFWNRVDLDFKPVQTGGLFLIHGPVGSGKTTLLDGICYALYGVSSGGERTPEQLRCDMAADSTPTVVEFAFEAEQALWTIERRTDQVVLLQSGKPITADAQEVTGQIQRLIGLNASQFCRSVLLPQGQFRQFLLAATEEREQILTALFHTYAPAFIQETLIKALAQTEEQLSQAWKNRENLSEVHNQIQQQEEHLATLTAQLRRWKEQIAHVQQDRQRSAVVGERSREYQRLLQQLNELRERDDDFVKLKQQVERLQAALKLAPQVEQWEQAQKDQLQAQDNFQQVKSDMEERKLGLASPDEIAGALEADQMQLQAIQGQLKDLERYNVENQRLLQAEERLHNCHKAFQQIEEEGQALTQEWQAAERRLSEVKRIGEEEESLRQQLAVRQQQLEGMRHSHKLGRQKEELQIGIQRLQKNLVSIGERRNKLLAHIDTLEQDLQERQRLLEIYWSHILAKQLKPGSPCPVCGALEHPHLAAEEGSSLQISMEQGRKQLNLAWTQAEKIEQEEQEQRIMLARLEERLLVISDQLQPLPVASTEELQGISSSLRDLEQDLQRLHNYRKHQERDQKRAEKIRLKLDEWQEICKQAQQALLQSQTIVNERRDLLPEELRQENALRREREHLQQALEPLRQSIEQSHRRLETDSHLFTSFQMAQEVAAKNLEWSIDRTRLSWDLVQTSLKLQGFADLDEWRNYYIQGQADAQQLQAELSGYQSKLEGLQTEAELAEQRYHESLEGWCELDLDPDRLEQQLQITYAQVAQTQEQLRQSRQRIQEYEDSLQQIYQLEPRLAILRRLNRSAAGDNKVGISFSQWVLSRQMENVLVAANIHLSQMTRGRYTLVATQKALELSVLDHMSGLTRAVATLSGGESFLASLALALGLSDSFSATDSEAVLETLFIDEGFGYLDEDGLDQAFQALESIRKHGRIIGVVSHLAEVRQRIDARLEICPYPDGFKLQWNN